MIAAFRAVNKNVGIGIVIRAKPGYGAGRS